MMRSCPQLRTPTIESVNRRKSICSTSRATSGTGWKADDTQALKKAIEAAAANGGGIVLVPDGNIGSPKNGTGVGWNCEATVADGMISNKRAQLGSVLFIETGEGEGGTPFLTTGWQWPGGMGFYYPNQNYKSFKSIPGWCGPMAGNYVIDCSLRIPTRDWSSMR